MSQYELHTDGACSSNPGPGGWGAVLLGPNPDAAPAKILGEFYGGAAETTNNRMELTAILQALRHEPADYRAEPLTISSDSQYVVHAFTQGWLAKWQRNGWKTAKKEPVKNDDLWPELAAAVAARPGPVQWQWVKGHSGDYWNEYCDRMAVRAGREVQRLSAEFQRPRAEFQEGSGCYAGQNFRPDGPQEPEILEPENWIEMPTPAAKPPARIAAAAAPAPERQILYPMPCLGCGAESLQGKAAPASVQPGPGQPGRPPDAGAAAKRTWILACAACGELQALSLESRAADSLTRPELAALPWG